VPLLKLRTAAALFDMDGTLIDSTAVVEQLWHRFCVEHRVDAARLIPFSHGRRTRDTVDHFLPDATSDERAAISAELDRRELTTLDGIVEIPGARELLRDLEVPWAVVTSAPRELAVRRMAAAGLPVPAVLVAADQIERGKPDPDGYPAAAARLGVPAADCVVLEDAEPGVRAGLAAGARVVVVGGLETSLTRGLDRVPDLRGVALAPLP
jgi:mannitol-1-/sugar-/sorbitol-6-phosphatase